MNAAPPSPCFPRPRRRSQQIALGVLLALTFVVVAWMAAPLLVGLALGTVVGFTAQPFHARLSARLRQRRSLAAALTTLLAAVLMGSAAFGAGWLLVHEIVNDVPAIERGIASCCTGFDGPTATRIFAALHVNRDVVVERLRDEFGKLGGLLASAAGIVAQTSVGILLTTVMALWTTYYVLLDWGGIATHLERLLPLDPQHTRALVAEFRDVGRRAFVGTVVTAAIQGTLAGIGFVIFGVPQAPVWGLLLGLASFIPVGGTMIVWIPVAVFLLAGGHVVRAVLLTGWCLTFVMAANDYVVRPRLVGHSTGASHPLLMLVGLIGGITVFGMAGLIVGPVLIALFLATARIYERERGQEIAATAPQPLTIVETAGLRLHVARRRARRDERGLRSRRSA